MKALIFAAGLGSRLKPLTDHTPKALLKIHGKPLIAYAIEKLVKVGVTEIIVNVHYLAEQIIAYLDASPYSNIKFFISDERALLLDTGGGLKKAAHFFNDNHPFFVYNADILTDLDLLDMLNFHRKNAALATLAVSDRATGRYFIFDDGMYLRGWTNIKTQNIIPENLVVENLKKRAFSGIHIIDPRLLMFLENDGKYSIIPEYLRLCTQHPIIGYDHTGIRWIDIGKPESFAVAEDLFK